MNTPAPLSMFIIGTIVFVLYIIGYVYMIYKPHNQQKKELELVLNFQIKLNLYLVSMQLRIIFQL